MEATTIIMLSAIAVVLAVVLARKARAEHEHHNPQFARSISSESEQKQMAPASKPSILKPILPIGRLGQMDYFITNFLVVGSWILIGAAMAFFMATSADVALWFSGQSPLPKASTLCILLPLGAAFIYSVVVSIMAGIRRLHDRDRRGYWLLLFRAIPYAMVGMVGAESQQFSIKLDPAQGILILIACGLYVWGFAEFLLLPGTDGPNRFGPDPLEWARPKPQGVTQ